MPTDDDLYWNSAEGRAEVANLYLNRQQSIQDENIVAAAPPRANAALGSWFPVPDGAVEVVDHYFGFWHDYFLTWNGGQILLNDNEIQFSSTNYLKPLWYTVTNARVRATPNTVAGLIALGIISPGDSPQVIRNASDESPLTASGVISSIAPAAGDLADSVGEGVNNAGKQVVEVLDTVKLVVIVLAIGIAAYLVSRGKGNAGII